MSVLGGNKVIVVVFLVNMGIVFVKFVVWVLFGFVLMLVEVIYLVVDLGN